MRYYCIRREADVDQSCAGKQCQGCSFIESFGVSIGYSPEPLASSGMERVVINGTSELERSRRDRMEMAYSLRCLGLTYREIGKKLWVGPVRARQLCFRGEQEHRRRLRQPYVSFALTAIAA